MTDTDANVTPLYADGSPAAEATEQAAEKDWTGTRRVLRYRPEWDVNGTATIKVGANPVYRASNGRSVWVEVDGGSEESVEIVLASVPTGHAVPEGATYLDITRPDGAIRHLYRVQ